MKLKIPSNFRLLHLLIIFSLIAQISYCQSTGHKVISISDSLLSAGKSFKETLLSGLKQKSFKAVKTFSARADSISLGMNDSLSFSRKDSLRLVRTLLQENLTKNSDSFPLELIKIHDSFSNKLNSVKLISFDNENDASDSLIAINEEYKDVMANTADDFYDSFKDTVDNAIDSLNNYSQTLLDNQNNENDQRDSLWDNYYTFGLFAKSGYTSDIQYRGYKGAAAQNAYFPGLYYNNKNGIGLLINAYTISGTSVPWDEIEIGASYSHSFGERFSASVSYTNYTFTDTTEFAKQGVSGIAAINLGYDLTFLSIGSSFDAAFGSETDYSIVLNFSKTVMFSKKENHRIWLEPSFSAIYGTESLLNDRIVTQKNKKNKPGKSVIISSKNTVFSILDYQLSIPLNIQIGRFIITPEYDFSAPLNQPPFTDSSSFGFFTINVALKIF